MKFKLLLKLKDFCYYDYKGNLVWVKNKRPYQERTTKGILESLKKRKEI